MKKDKVTKLEANFDKIAPLLKMILPMVGGLEGLSDFFVDAVPLLNNALGKYLESKKEQYKAVFEKGGYNAITLSCIKFNTQDAGFMILGLKYKNKQPVPVSISEPLEIISTKDLVNLLIASIPLEELQKEL